MRHNIVTRLDIKVIIATRLIKMKILSRDTWRKKFKISFVRETNCQIHLQTDPTNHSLPNFNLIRPPGEKK